MFFLSHVTKKKHKSKTLFKLVRLKTDSIHDLILDSHSKGYLQLNNNNWCYDIELQATIGAPICVRTLSNHCNGPFRCSSIQHGVDVTVCRLKI